MAADRVLVGAFAGAFGVRGDVRLKSFCATPEAIAEYAPLWSEDGSRSFRLRIKQLIPNGFAVRVDGIATKDKADALRGLQLFVDRDRLPSLPDDEFYHADLIGLPVFDTGGAALGSVRAVLNHGAGDILEILAPGARQPLLLPFTRRSVPTVDLTAGRIVADPPEEAPDE
jgi:16S rRNA processing protein RimM